MKTILLTGFGTWGLERYNSSWEALRDADFRLPKGWRCDVRQLPVTWTQASRLLRSRIKPDVKAVVCFGMTGGDQILIERIATNLIIPTLTVVDDKPYRSEFVRKSGPPAYWTGLPHKAICARLRKLDISCGESQWAGSHTCNFLFYWLMDYIARSRPDIVGGFIHVPPFDEHGGMQREKLCLAVNAIARTIASRVDQREVIASR